MKVYTIKAGIPGIVALLLILNMALSVHAAQPNVVLNGYVKDKNNGESLIGVSVKVLDLSAGTSSNTYGFYSLTLKPGRHTLLVKYIGYKDYETTIDIEENATLDFLLEPAGREMRLRRLSC